MAARYAVDTNVLLRLSRHTHPQHKLIATAMRRLVQRDVGFCFTPQNLGEFWNASTRPQMQNGFGLSIDETDAQVQAIERNMTLLVEDEQVYPVRRRLLRSQQVQGAQVHDAHLAATLEVHGVSHLLILNGKDFRRFAGLTPVHPEEVLP